jgi:hypothetical protein
VRILPSIAVLFFFGYLMANAGQGNRIIKKQKEKCSKSVFFAFFIGKGKAGKHKKKKKTFL